MTQNKTTHNGPLVCWGRVQCLRQPAQPIPHGSLLGNCLPDGRTIRGERFPHVNKTLELHTWNQHLSTKTNTHPTHLYQIAHAHANKHATTKTKNAHANQHATTKKANFLHRPLQMQNPFRNCPLLVVQQTSTKLINDPTPQAIEGEVVLLLDFLVKFFFLLQLASCPLQLGVQPPNFTQCLLQLASRLLQLACK